MVVIHVDGAISLAVQQGYAPLNTRTTSMTDTTYAGSKAPPTGLVYRGWTYSAFSVTVTYATSGYTPSLVADPNVSDGARTDTLWVVHGEELLVTRSTVSSRMTCTRAYPGELPCGTPAGPDSMYNVPSYHLTGSQSIYIERLDDRISLSAAPSTGGKGRTVTFTPNIPRWDGSITGARWLWRPDSGAAQGVACYTASPCTATVATSGTMQLTVSFGGHATVPALSRTATVRATAVDCPNADSVLNDPNVRTRFMQMDSASKPFDTESNRKEHVGLVARDHFGNYYVLDIPTNPGTNNCLSKWNIPTPQDLDGDEMIAIVHTHPYAVGDSIHCSDGRTGTAAPGGSPEYDWPTIDSVNSSFTFVSAGWHVPFYIVDTYNVYKMDPDGVPGPDKAPVAQWRKKSADDPACTWQ